VSERVPSREARRYLRAVLTGRPRVVVQHGQSKPLVVDVDVVLECVEAGWIATTDYRDAMAPEGVRLTDAGEKAVAQRRSS
jgi:hypothetical protein